MARIAGGTLASGLLVFSGKGTALQRAIARRTRPGIAGDAASIAAFALLGWLAGKPLDFYSGYVVEHKYDLSNQTPADWLAEELKGLGVEMALEVPLTLGLYTLIRRRPNDWWLIASGLSIPFVVLMAQLAPVLIMPLFNKFEPLRDRELAERLKRFTADAGVEVADVMQMDMSRQTKKSNAFFAGLGSTKRIVLADTMLESFSEEEIEVVLAHEMSHQLHHDIWRFIALGSAFTLGGAYTIQRGGRWLLERFGDRIGTDDLGDIASLPALSWLMSLIGLLVMPLPNADSRRIERRADDFALRLTQNPLGFASAMERLSDENLSDPAPPLLVRLLLYNHPPVAERIEQARRFARENALPEPAAFEG